MRNTTCCTRWIVHTCRFRWETGSWGWPKKNLRPGRLMADVKTLVRVCFRTQLLRGHEGRTIRSREPGSTAISTTPRARMSPCLFRHDGPKSVERQMGASKTNKNSKTRTSSSAIVFGMQGLSPPPLRLLQPSVKWPFKLSQVLVISDAQVSLLPVLLLNFFTTQNTITKSVTLVSEYSNDNSGWNSDVSPVLFLQDFCRN